MILDDFQFFFNWSMVGSTLKDFVRELVDSMEWGPLIDSILSNINTSLLDERRAKVSVLVKVLVDAVFYELDFEDDVEQCVTSMRVSEAMARFFPDDFKGVGFLL